MPIFLPATESDVGVNNITLRWIAELGPDPHELVVKNQTGSVEATYRTNQSGLVIWCNRGFHKHTKLPTLGLLPNFYSPLYLHHLMLVNVKLDISGYELITFHGCRFPWSGAFLMAWLKQS